MIGPCVVRSTGSACRRFLQDSRHSTAGASQARLRTEEPPGRSRTSSSESGLEQRVAFDGRVLRPPRPEGPGPVPFSRRVGPATAWHARHPGAHVRPSAVTGGYDAPSIAVRGLLPCAIPRGVGTSGRHARRCPRRCDRMARKLKECGRARARPYRWPARPRRVVLQPVPGGGLVGCSGLAGRRGGGGPAAAARLDDPAAPAAPAPLDDPAAPADGNADPADGDPGTPSGGAARRAGGADADPAEAGRRRAGPVAVDAARGAASRPRWPCSCSPAARRRWGAACTCSPARGLASVPPGCDRSRPDRARRLTAHSISLALACAGLVGILVSGGMLFESWHARWVWLGSEEQQRIERQLQRVAGERADPARSGRPALAGVDAGRTDGDAARVGAPALGAVPAPTPVSRCARRRTSHPSGCSCRRRSSVGTRSRPSDAPHRAARSRSSRRTSASSPCRSRAPVPSSASPSGTAPTCRVVPSSSVSRPTGSSTTASSEPSRRSSTIAPRTMAFATSSSPGPPPVRTSRSSCTSVPSARRLARRRCGCPCKGASRSATCGRRSSRRGSPSDRCAR